MGLLFISCRHTLHSSHSTKSTAESVIQNSLPFLSAPSLRYPPTFRLHVQHFNLPSSALMQAPIHLVAHTCTTLPLSVPPPLILPSRCTSGARHFRQRMPMCSRCGLGSRRECHGNASGERGEIVGHATESASEISVVSSGPALARYVTSSEGK